MFGKKEYHYHVVYNFSEGHGNGVGSIELSRNKSIRSFGDLRELKEDIKKRKGLDEVVIINWIRLKEGGLK